LSPPSVWESCVGNSDGDANANTCDITDLNTTLGASAANNVSVDPGFIDLGTGAFYPSSSSPAVITSGGIDTTVFFNTNLDFFRFDRATTWGIGAISNNY